MHCDFRWQGETNYNCALGLAPVVVKLREDVEVVRRFADGAGLPRLAWVTTVLRGREVREG